MRKAHKRATAKRDLIAHFVYLVENAGIDTADRFLANAEESFADLAEQPRMGEAVPLRDERLAEMRRWQVKGFEKFLIFYQPRTDGVSIIRVLHAAQDWWKILGVAT